MTILVFYYLFCLILTFKKLGMASILFFSCSLWSRYLRRARVQNQDSFVFLARVSPVVWIEEDPGYDELS